MKKCIFLLTCFCLCLLKISAQNTKGDTTEITTVEITDHGPRKYTDTIPSLSLRLNTPLIEVPQNITVINQDAMKDFGINQITDVAKISAGIQKTYGMNSDFSFKIRGFDATYGNFRDGIGWFWWNQQADAFMLEKIEIVKGPAGFLVANAQAGGFINEVTKQADRRKVREIELGYGSFNLSRIGIDFGDKFSKQSKFSYRIVAGGQFTQANYDFYESYRIYIVPSIRYTYKNESDIQVEYNGMNGHYIADSYVNVSYDTKDHMFSENFNCADINTISGMQTNDNFIRISNTHHFKKGWTLNTQLASAWGIWTGDQMYGSNVSSTFDTIYREHEYIDLENDLMTGQSYLNGKFNTGKKIEHSVLTGIEYGNTAVHLRQRDFYDLGNYGNHLAISVTNPQYNLTEGDLTNITMLPQDGWRTIWMSWFGQDQVKFFDKLILIVGGRFTYTELSIVIDSLTRYDNAFTPRYGLMFLINKNISVYAVHDESFLPQFGRKIDGTAPNPEESKNNELGLKAELFKRQLMLNVALFQIEKNNMLVSIPQTTFYDERGQQTNKGIELSVTGNINANIVVLANYAYIDAKITEDPDSSIVGFPAFGVPLHSGNLNIRYRFLKGILTGLSLGIGAQMIGEKGAAIPFYTDANEKNKTGAAYNLFDANVGYDIRKFRFHFNVYNMFNNQKYFEQALWHSSFDPSVKGYYTGAANPMTMRFTAGYIF